jgi:hypothetical protein
MSKGRDLLEKISRMICEGLGVDPDKWEDFVPLASDIIDEVGRPYWNEVHGLPSHDELTKLLKQPSEQPA